MNVYGLDLSYNMVEIALERLSGIGGNRVRILPAFYVHIYLTGLSNIVKEKIITVTQTMTPVHM